MRKIYSILSLFLIVFLLSSCAQKMRFATSPVVPAATGAVKVKKDKNDNYSIDVKVVNLANARDLTPPKNTYVVWMESERNRVRNLGQMQPSSGLLSKTLKGELEATATSKPTRIFITAEDEGNVQYPGMQLVLSTD